MQRSCPHHGLPRDVLIRTFYNGVARSTRDTIDVVAGGSLMRKIDVAFGLLEEMANYNCLWPSKRLNLPRQAKNGGDMVASLQAQIANLSRQLSDLNVRAASIPSNSQLPSEGCSMMGHVGEEFDMENFGM